ncbi:MAG TPA: GGDEF domain-containing protein [Limnochordia bacterium]|nr:GGDEF domain-containing protein [Limnochordia bacterium]
MFVQPTDSKQVHRNMYVITAMTVALGFVFADGFEQTNWHVVLFLTALAIFLQESAVSITERSSISLGITLILPAIYLCGATSAMLIFAFRGLFDGVWHKKSWQRTMFNSAQFALSTLMAALTAAHLRDLFGPSELGLFGSLVGATVAYIMCNKSLVARVGSVRRGTTWVSEMSARMGTGFYSHVTSGFTGIVFTFFIISYSSWGLIVFSALVVVLSRLLQAAAEVSYERDKRVQLEEELILDNMTGAYNFRYLNNWLCEPSDEAVSLLFLDVDDFAVFNDIHGHAEGNKMLKALVETIYKSIKPEDSVIRYGGDEFVILLWGRDARGARHTAQRIRENLASSNHTKKAAPITVSLGIAAKPEHTDDKRQLLLFADQAMYRAKNTGKDSVQTWAEFRETQYSQVP